MIRSVDEHRQALRRRRAARSDDGGDSWTSIADGLPSDFGFALVVHPREPETVYVFPIEDAGERFPPDGRVRVWRSRDGGRAGEELGEGLPDHFYAAVMRDAMCVDDADPAGIYLGARNGCVFASNDEGESWAQVAENLPDVMVVRAALV